MKIIWGLFSLLIMLGEVLCAHPTSFKGSRGVMGYHSPDLTHNQVSYSKEYWFAVGAHHYQRPKVENTNASFLSTNFLLKRWNGSDYQGNLYLVTGLGQSKLFGSSEDASLVAVQYDIEDREYYFLTKSSLISTKNRTDLRSTKVRIGMAPYVVNFDGLHSWLILEYQESSFGDDTSDYELTPFVRVFYKNLLFELGQSFDGLTKFNYITHF